MTELANIIGAWVRRGAVALSLFGLLCAVPAHALYYGYTTTTFSWIDPVAGAHTAAVWTSGASCTAGTYVNAPGDDDITAQIPIGFTFNFGGTGYTQLQIMTNEIGRAHV